MEKKKTEKKADSGTKETPWSYRPPRDVKKMMEIMIKEKKGDRSEIITAALRNLDPDTLARAFKQIADDEVAASMQTLRTLKSKFGSKT